MNEEGNLIEIPSKYYVWFIPDDKFLRVRNTNYSHITMPGPSFYNLIDSLDISDEWALFDVEDHECTYYRNYIKHGRGPHTLGNMLNIKLKLNDFYVHSFYDDEEMFYIYTENDNDAVMLKLAL